MLEEHVLLFFIWILYYVLHSLLASNWLKAKVKLKPKSFRLIYSMIASILLFLVLLLTATTYSQLIFMPGPIANYAGLMLSAIGIFILKRSFRQYSLREFVGLKVEEHPKLNTNGIQSKIRHPLYTGTILLFLGYFIFNPQFSNLVMLLSLFLYLPFGIHFEEKKLIEVFGEDYATYKKQTPAILPNFKKKAS